jgi:hypothetical protein
MRKATSTVDVNDGCTIEMFLLIGYEKRPTKIQRWRGGGKGKLAGDLLKQASSLSHHDPTHPLPLSLMMQSKGRVYSLQF